MRSLRLTGRFLIGLDIGGTKLAAVVADRDGTILQKVRRPTEAARGPRPIVESLCEMVREVAGLASVRLTEVAGIGVSCGGPLDTATGIVYSPPNLPGWDGIPLMTWLEESLDIAALVENDANAEALAEWLFGAGRGYRNVVYMTMSTGIGGGLILDGRLYRGTCDAAGEVGHMTLVPNGPRCGCGKRGCLEALCSGPAIARRARELIAKTVSGLRSQVPGQTTGLSSVQTGQSSLMVDLANGDVNAITAETVMNAARRGDATALRVVDETAQYMAQGLGTLINVLNPEIIIIGTIIVKAGDLLLSPIREYLKQETWDRLYRAVRIVPAALGDAVGDLAAIAVVRQALEAQTQ